MEQREFLLRVPSNSKGEQFLKDFREYLNSNTYQLNRVRYSGKRRTRFAAHTRKIDATSMRIYITDKRTKGEAGTRSNISTNLQTLISEVEIYKFQVTGLRQKLAAIKSYIERMA